MQNPFYHPTTQHETTEPIRIVGPLILSYQSTGFPEPSKPGDDAEGPYFLLL